MKRAFVLFCALLGSCVVVQAGFITSPTSALAGVGGNSALQNFDNSAAFPIGPDNTVSFVMSAGTTSTNVTITASGATSGQFNLGNEFRIDTGAGARYGASSSTGVGSLSGRYLQTYNGGDASAPASYVRTLTITFSPAVTEFLIDYFDNNNGGTPFAAPVQISGRGGISASLLVAQNCGGATSCAGTGKQIGFVADSSISQINSVTFTFNGPDQSALSGGDLVIFDNLRVVGSAAQTGAFGTGKMVNISTRGKVGTGSEVMIAGFVIEGGPRRVLIRGVGPTLGGLGVPGALANPFLTLLRGQMTIATNDDWGQSANATAIRTAAAASGAFVIDNASRDAAMLIDLEAGAYTAQVSGVNDTTGVALVEVYEAR